MSSHQMQNCVTRSRTSTRASRERGSATPCLRGATDCLTPALMGLMNTDVSVLTFVGVCRSTSLSGFAFLPSPSGCGMPWCHADFKIPASPFLRIQHLVSSLYFCMCFFLYPLCCTIMFSFFHCCFLIMFRSKCRKNKQVGNC